MARRSLGMKWTCRLLPLRFTLFRLVGQQIEISEPTCSQGVKRSIVDQGLASQVYGGELVLDEVGVN